MWRMNPRRAVLAGALAVLALGEVTGGGPLLLGGGKAEAVIGRPLTPGSYAGVARRTTRRAAYVGAAHGAYYGAPGAYYGGYHPAYPAYRAYPAPVVAPTATVVTTLPAGCGPFTGSYYQCGAVRYAPAYNGPTIVYRRL